MLVTSLIHCNNKTVACCMSVISLMHCNNITNERAKELNGRYMEAVRHWNIAGRPRSGPLAELKCRARDGMKLNFSERMRINFVLIKCYQNFRGENAIIYLRKLKHSNLRRNPCVLQWEEILGEQYCKPMEKSFQSNFKFCWL